MGRQLSANPFGSCHVYALRVGWGKVVQGYHGFAEQVGIRPRERYGDCIGVVRLGNPLYQLVKAVAYALDAAPARVLDELVVRYAELFCAGSRDEPEMVRGLLVYVIEFRHGKSITKT